MAAEHNEYSPRYEQRKNLLNRDPFYGKRGQLESTLTEAIVGPRIDTVAHLGEITDWKTLNTAMNHSWSAALLLVANGDYEAANAVIRDVMWPYQYVTPSTSGYHPKDLGKPTDAKQRIAYSSKATIAGMQAYRHAMETSTMSPVQAVEILSGTSENEIERMIDGSPEKNRAALQTIGLSIFGAIALYTASFPVDIPDWALTGGEMFFASTGALGVAAGAYNLPRTLRLSDNGEKVQKYLQEIAPKNALIYPMLYDLSTRRAMRQYQGATPYETIGLISMMDHLGTPDIVAELGILEDQPVANIPSEKEEDYYNALLYDRYGRIYPLSHILGRSLVLEETKNNNRKQRNQQPMNALPIFGKNNLPELKHFILTNGKERLDGIKQLGKTDVVKNEHNAPYYALMTAYPHLSQLLFADADWQQAINPALLKSMNDMVYHSQVDFTPLKENAEPGRNYIGWGIEADLVRHYWQGLSLDYTQTREFAVDAVQDIFPTDDKLKGFKALPRLASIGINGLNSYGKLMTTIAAAAHYDPSNQAVGEGYMKEMEDNINVLITRSIKNPADIQVLLTLLSVQTHVIREGNTMIRYFGGINQGNEGVDLMYRGIENITKLRGMLVRNLLNVFFQEPKKVITDVRANYPHDLLYHALSWITREAPDLAPHIITKFSQVVDRSGDGGSNVNFNYGILYMAGYLKQQLVRSSDTDTDTVIDLSAKNNTLQSGGNPRTQQQKLTQQYRDYINVCERVLLEGGNQALEIITTEDYALSGFEWLSRNVQYLSNAMFLGNTETLTDLVTRLNIAMEQHLNVKTIPGEDFRAHTDPSEIVHMLRAIRSAGYAAVRRMSGRTNADFKDLLNRTNGNIRQMNEAFAAQFNANPVHVVHTSK